MQASNPLYSSALKKTSLFLVVITSLALFLPSGKAAVVINVDFNGGLSTSTYSGQGGYSDPGNNTWNAFSMGANGGWVPAVASSALVDSAGGATSAIVTLYGIRSYDLTTYNGGSLTAGNALIDDFAYTPSSDTAPTIPGFTFPTGYSSGFRISGLTPGASYSLYLFGSTGISANPTDYNVNSTVQSVTGRSSAGSPTIFTQGTDYTIFSSLTADGSGYIDGYLHASPGSGSGQGELSGMQLVAVPEPTTISLLSLGGLALLMRRKFRRHEQLA